MEPDEAIARIAEIDAAFAAATGWGSWMVMVANEREGLAEWLQANGFPTPHRYQARLSDGRRTD
jgi:hypothetical protein